MDNKKKIRKTDHKEETTELSKGKSFLRSLIIVLSSAFCGASVQIFVMIPCGMTSGGIPGVARIITHFMPTVSYSVVYYALQMIILIIAFVTMGKAEVGRIIALVFTYPVMLFIFEKTGYELLSEPDPFLASVLIGIFYGLATGIGYIGGFSSGGTDTIARVLKFKLLNHIRVGDIQMAIDVTIIAISAFVFDMNVALYAAVNAFIAAKVIAAVMVGYSGQFIQFDIISSEPDKIADYIMNDVGRAVTSHISVGEYSHTERKTLTVICSPTESIRIKKFVAETDPDAFATIMPVNTVWGKRFSDIREVDNV